MIPKFRAWWKSEEKMITDISFLRFKHRDLLGRVDGQSTLPISFDDIILMQSTGLFDKNGKEIFEGDLLRMDDGSKGIIKVEAVESGNFAVKTFLSTECSAYIAGNIHEHPELVEVRR